MMNPTAMPTPFPGPPPVAGPTFDEKQLVTELTRLAREVSTRHRKGDGLALMSSLVAIKPLLSALLESVQTSVSTDPDTQTDPGADATVHCGPAGYL